MLRPERLLAKPRYRFPKRAQKIVKNRKMTLMIVTLAYTFFILMGGIFDIVNKVPFVGYTRQGFTVVFQSLNRQFVAEGFIAAFMIFLAALGLWLIEASVKYLEEPQRGMIYSVVGLLLVIFAIAIIEYMMSIKT